MILHFHNGRICISDLKKMVQNEAIISTEDTEVSSVASPKN